MIAASGPDGSVSGAILDVRWSGTLTSDHRFGGDWTATKLEVLDRYLTAYMTALKNTRFNKFYIDAFAGTGYRDARRSSPSSSPDQEELFPDLAESEPQELLEGSARIALRTEPRFDRYLFIEKKPKRCEALRALAREFPDRTDDVVVQQGEANEAIQKLCKRDWRSSRAVLFLDPYGMQVDWATVEAVAATEAIDLWLLYPFGIGVNRLLPRSGDVPEEWQEKLDAFLGTRDWRQAFYHDHTTRSLFGDKTETVKASMEVIAHFFLQRLQSIFAGVADPPGVLQKSRGCTLYLLCFAVANPAGAKVALPIAKHLIKGMR